MNKILVVDDERVIVDAARRILTAEGYDVHTCGDAETALAAMAAPPDVALVDLKLPGLSGLDLLDVVRARHPGIVVVVTSGYADVETAVSTLRAGAFDFLPKPFTFDELLSPVRRALRYLEDGLHAAPVAPAASVRTLGLQAWARLDDDDTALLGVTETFATTAGSLAAVALPSPNELVWQGGPLARLTAADGLTHVARAALSGRIVAVNERLSEHPALAADPFGDGWIARIHPLNPAQELAMLEISGGTKDEVRSAK